MKKDPALYLRHILESIQAIEEYTEGWPEEASWLTGGHKTR